MVAGQRTTRHHWPIFVFTGYFHAWIFSLPRTNTRGNAACEYVDPRVVIFLYTLKHEKHHACEYVDPRVVIFLHTLNHRKYHACEYSDSRVTNFLFTLNNAWYQARSQGGSVGSDEPPSQIKGPLLCTKRSTFYNKRSTFYNKGPLFTIKVHFSQ